MKNLTVLFITLTLSMLSCNQTSKKEVNQANKELKDAKEGLKHAGKIEREVLREETAEDWNYFKNESDSMMLKMDNDLTKLEGITTRLNAKDKQKLDSDHKSARIDIARLKKQLHRKNIAFDNDMQFFNDKSVEESEMFKRNFRHDMEEVEKSIKKLYKSDRR